MIWLAFGYLFLILDCLTQPYYKHGGLVLPHLLCHSFWHLWEAWPITYRSEGSGLRVQRRDRQWEWEERKERKLLWKCNIKIYMCINIVIYLCIIILHILYIIPLSKIIAAYIHMGIYLSICEWVTHLHL